MADEEVLQYKFGLDPKDAIKAATKFQKEMDKALKKVEHGSDAVNNSFTKYMAKMEGSKKVFGPLLQKQLKMFENTKEALKDANSKIRAYTKEVASLDAVLKELEERSNSASGDQLKALKDQISQTKALKKARQETLGTYTDQKKTQQEAMAKITEVAKEARQKVEIEPTLVPDALKEAGTELMKPFKAFASKDLPSLMEEGGSLASKSFQSFKAMGTMDMKGTQAGAMLKGVAGLSKALQPVLSVISKMGPMLSLAGSFVLGLVKLFVDAEASAKEFNKQVLETTSTSGFMAQNMRDVDKAAENAAQTMRDAYASAFDLRNLSRGITKETHAAAMSALAAEGMPITEINKQIAQVGKTSKETAASIRDVGDVTWQAVAYSRQFGISLNEIIQLQGEMMTEMGAGLTAVRTSFAEIERGAEEAGMASNKFFGMVRSFSADLSLFALRMGDVTKVLTVLSKTMSPRNAQKFLQTVTQQFKGAGLMDRTRSTLLAGKGATKGILQKDVTRRVEGLVEDLKDIGIGDELKGVIAKGDTKGAVKFMSQFAGQISGAQREAILDATMMQGKLNSGNMIEIASALKDASPMAAIQTLDQISLKRFGKPMDKLVGLQKVAFENMTGFNDEQIDQQRKMVAGLQQVQYDLAAKIEKGDENLTQVEEDMLKKLGINAKSADAAEEIRAKTSNEIWHSMDSDQKGLLKTADKTEKFQEKIAGLQQTVTDKMGVLVDFVMGKFYNTIMDIYDAIMGLWNSLPWGGPKKQIKSWAGQDKNKPITEPQKAGYKVLRDLVLGMDESKRAAYNEEIKKSGGRGELSLKDQFKKALKFADPDKAKKAAIEWTKGTRAAKAGGPPGTAAAPTAMGTPPQIKGSTEEAQKATTDSVEKVSQTIKKGVPLAKPSSAYKSSIKDSTLDAIRKGLFEYYLYSGMNRANVAASLASGMDPMGFVEGVVGETAKYGSTDAALGAMTPGVMQGNAVGGVVTGLSGNMASVDRFPPAPPGEGWAAVKPGETIVPAGRGGGGGGGTIELRLKGDLARFIDARVIDGAAKFQKNRRLR